MNRKSIAELSADSAVLISELSQLERGTEVSYSEHFTNWLGRPIKNRSDLPNFATVVTRLRTDHGKLLSPIPGVGYRILTHSEAVNNDAQLNRARRAAFRRKKELGTVELSELTDLQKMQWAAKVTQSHLIEETANSKTQKKLEIACNGSNTPLALAKAFEAIRGNV